MNLKEFIKGKKLELKCLQCNFDVQNYGYALFNSGYVGKKNTNFCVIFDKNLDITFFDNTISDIYGDEYLDIFCISKNKGDGVIDPFGKEIIPCAYDSICLNRVFESNDKIPIWARKDKKEMLFDRNGTPLSKFYDEIYYWNDISREYFAFRGQEYSGVINYSGQELFKLKWVDLEFLTKNILTYKDNFEHGLIDINGKILTEAKYEDFKKLSDNNILAIKPDRSAEIITLEN